MSMTKNRKSPNYEIQAWLENSEKDKPPFPENKIFHPMFANGITITLDTNDPGVEGLQWVYLDDIEPFDTNGNFTTGKSAKRVMNILYNFRAHDFEPVRLMRLQNGKVKVSRGHHRIEFLRRLGIGKVLAFVMNGKSEVGVATDYINETQIMVAATKNSEEKFYALIREGNMDAIRTKEIFDIIGIRPASNRSTPNGVESISTIFTLGNDHRDGWDKVFVTLQIIYQVSDGSPSWYTADIIKSICYFVSDSWDKFKPGDYTRLIECLKNKNPKIIATDLKLQTNQDRRTYKTQIITSIYKTRKGPRPAATITMPTDEMLFMK